MCKDAELYADEDWTRNEAIRIRNEAQKAIFRIEKILNDPFKKLSSNLIANAKTTLEVLKNAMSFNDIDKICEATIDLLQLIDRTDEQTDLVNDQTIDVESPTPPARS